MLYDTIGKGYAAQRRSDPRIAAVLHRALSGADSLVNVGAGTGSYEPGDRSVVAIEPSLTMIRQRPPGAAPAIQAIAERLPLRDHCASAATVPHVCIDGFLGAKMSSISGTDPSSLMGLVLDVLVRPMTRL